MIARWKGGCIVNHRGKAKSMATNQGYYGSSWFYQNQPGKFWSSRDLPVWKTDKRLSGISPSTRAMTDAQEGSRLPL